MKKFLAVYVGTPSSPARGGWDALSEEERQARQQAGIEAWGRWAAEHGGAIVDHGAPLGKTLRASREGISDTTNNLCGYTIVQADSHAAAVRLFARHPHFMSFPGDAVEVMECLPIPE